jgi:hypothetical protein
MEKLKNVRRGMLVIADAGLKLTPGQTIEVETPTKQMEALLASGHLARAGKKPPAPRQTEMPEAADLSKMTAQEAIASINDMDDPEHVQAQMRTEKRRSVLDALERKKKELTGGNE